MIISIVHSNSHFPIFHDIIFRFMIYVMSYSELFMYCVHGSYNSVFTRSRTINSPFFI